jgi:DNA-binding response OmpR family regulator
LKNCSGWLKDFNQPESLEQIGYNNLVGRKILVVDDTHNIQVMLTDFLVSQDFEVVTASDGREAINMVEKNTPDLILLDIMMPNMDGYQFISQLRRTSDIPVIMITARAAEADLIHGFDLGADDYITKPFRMRELLVRLRAVMRRSSNKSESDRVITLGDISMDSTRHAVTRCGNPVELTPLEYQILELMIQSPGKVLKRADLAIYLMEKGYTGSEATLKIHIRNLRIKLDDTLTEPKYIETIFGIGYRFVESD